MQLNTDSVHETWFEGHTETRRGTLRRMIILENIYTNIYMNLENFIHAYHPLTLPDVFPTLHPIFYLTHRFQSVISIYSRI